MGSSSRTTRSAKFLVGRREDGAVVTFIRGNVRVPTPRPGNRHGAGGDDGRGPDAGFTIDRHFNLVTEIDAGAAHGSERTPAVRAAAER